MRSHKAIGVGAFSPCEFDSGQPELVSLVALVCLMHASHAANCYRRAASIVTRGDGGPAPFVIAFASLGT